MLNGLGASPSRNDVTSVMEASTFITKLPEDQSAAMPEECKEILLSIDDRIDRIDDRFAAQLQTHSLDFVNAYMGHMTKVKKELKFLKQEQDKVTSGLMNDDRITKLQDQIQWFKEESGKLNTILEGQKRTIVKQKNHGRETNQNIEFLNKSLKESMKQNKLLKVAAERQKAQNNNLKAFLAMNNVSTAIGSTDTTVKAAMNSQLVLSENLEKEVVSSDGALLTGKHSVAASMTDQDN